MNPAFFKGAIPKCGTCVSHKQPCMGPGRGCKGCSVQSGGKCSASCLVFVGSSHSTILDNKGETVGFGALFRLLVLRDAPVTGQPPCADGPRDGRRGMDKRP